jgi:hypothetical protein
LRVMVGVGIGLLVLPGVRCFGCARLI